MYILASGMLLQQKRLDVITNNLANVNTTSFKRDILLSALWETPQGQGIENTEPENPRNNFLYPVVERVFTDLSQGPIRQTGNPLDLAIEGQAYFAVRRGEEVLYTRAGNFRIDQEGYLTNQQGLRVLDENLREIRIEGSPTFGGDGSVFVDGNRITRLGLFDLTNLQKLGRDLYRGEAQPSANVRVLQGYLEGSNVNPILEMAGLIQVHRAHEVYSNLVRSLDALYERFNQSF